MKLIPNIRRHDFAVKVIVISNVFYVFIKDIFYFFY